MGFTHPHSVGMEDAGDRLSAPTHADCLASANQTAPQMPTPGRENAALPEESPRLRLLAGRTRDFASRRPVAAYMKCIKTRARLHSPTTRHGWQKVSPNVVTSGLPSPTFQ